MSKQNEQLGLRVLRGVAGYALTLLLVLSLTGACLSALAAQLLTNRALHERVALDDRVIDVQMARMEGTVAALAEQYGFAPEAVLNLMTRDAVRAYGREAVAWWTGLLTGESSPEAPFPEMRAMEDAVREDALFCEHTEEFMRRTVARDSVAYPIAKALQETVLPIRVSLVALAMPQIEQRVDLPALHGYGRMVVWGLWGLSAALLALLMLVGGRDRFLYGSVGLLATFILLAVLTATVALAGLPAALESLSPMLALQLSLLERALLLPAMLAEGALLVAGALMLARYLTGGARRKERKNA